MEQLANVEIGATVKDEWKVERRIAQGGFSCIYKVSDKKGGFYAMKAEGAFAKYQILKLEAVVLKDLQRGNHRHFVRILDKGHMTDYNFIVMTLVGKNLEDLVRTREGRHFSMGTSIGVSIKTLEALEDLHNVGYIHRDVKPANFAVGREETDSLRSVYVIDFGISRKYIKADGTIRRPRTAAGFRGTGRYASLSCHQLVDLGRKDDVESWAYMVVEFTVGILPWRDLTDINAVGYCKSQHHSEPALSVLVCGCAPEMKRIIQLNDACTYFDTPPYATIYGLLRAAFVSTGATEYPYDWEVVDPYFAQDEQQQQQPIVLVTPQGASPDRKSSEDDEKAEGVKEDAKPACNKKVKKVNEEKEEAAERPKPKEEPKAKKLTDSSASTMRGVIDNKPEKDVKPNKEKKAKAVPQAGKASKATKKTNAKPKKKPKTDGTTPKTAKTVTPRTDKKTGPDGNRLKESKDKTSPKMTAKEVKKPMAAKPTGTTVASKPFVFPPLPKKAAPSAPTTFKFPPLPRKPS